MGNPGQKLFSIKDNKIIPNNRLFELLEEATLNHDIEKVISFGKGVKDVVDDSAKEIFNLEEDTNYSELLTDNKTSDILFGDKKSVSLSAFNVLNNILDNLTKLEGKDNEKLLSVVRTLLNKSKAKVKFVEKLKESDTMMQYNSKTNTIEIDIKTLNTASQESIIVAFLHEAVHSITVNLYNEGGGIDAQIFRANLDSLFSIYKNNPIEGFDFDSPLEFLAEVFSNSLLKEAIMDNQVSRMNMWQQIIFAIRRLFGLPSQFDEKMNEIISSGQTIDSTSDQFPSLWERKKDAYQESITDLKTLKQKFEHTLGRLDRSLNQNISRLQKMSKKAERDGLEAVATTLNEKISTLNKIKVDIESSIENNTSLGIVNFIDSMTNILNYIEYKIDTIKPEDSAGSLYILTEYDNYLTTFSVVKDIQTLLTEFKTDPTQTMFTNAELTKLNSTLDTEVGRLSRLNGEIIDFKKQALFQKLNSIKYFPQILHKYRQKLGREFSELNLPGDKQVYINENLAVNGKEWSNMQADVEEQVNNLLENPIFDIKGVDKTFTSISNISNNLIQIFHKKLIELDNERIRIERKEDLKAFKVHEDLVKEKGTTNVNVLYKNITEKRSDGRRYLKGDFKSEFLIEVDQKIKNIFKEYQPKIDEKWIALVELKKTKGNTVEFAVANREYKEFVKKRDDLVESIRISNLLFDKDNKATPKDKWKNDITNLSIAEKNALAYYRGIIEEGDKAVWNSDTLKKYSYGAFFLELPKVTKSSLERIYQGDFIGSVKEKWDYLVETRADDIEYTNEDIDLAGKKHRQLRLHYRDRGNFKNELQSMDLATVFRLEFKNINIYKLRQQKEMELSFLIDIAKGQQFYSKNGNLLQRQLNSDKMNITTNENSNLTQMLTNLMDYRFYDITNSSDLKINKIDANKAVGYINAASAFMALSLNFASGTANVINANAQMFLETFIKGSTFNAKGIAKANKIYGKDLGQSLKDNVRGINKSFTNQIAEIFNTKGLFNLSDSNFLQATLLKKGMSLKSLQVFQDSGEHWIQAVLTMAVLDNIKVMNADNKFINKEGKEVKKISEAASILDMLKTDKDTGLVDLDSSVAYTTHSPNVKWNEGGKEMVDILIRKKLDDTIGNYTQTQQSEAYRHYAGRLTLLYRKYLVPMGQARLIGIENAFTEKDNLREDQVRFSHALQEYEEGTYVSLIRYSYTSLKTLKTEILTRGNWKNLSDYEKHNIKRAVTELILTGFILPKLIELSAMGASAMDDDDRQKMFFLMYQMRRLMTELSSYRSTAEMFKMLKSPIPSAMLIEGAVDMMEQSFPSNWFEEDASGNNLWLKGAHKFNPLRQFGKDFEKTFNYQNSNYKFGN